MCLNDPARLAALISACATLDAALPEREPHPEIFDDFAELSQALSDQKQSWPADFVRWEARMLTALGFGLDLTQCAVTGATEGLAYVSPKTGRAVTAEAGRLHRDRLLALPAFLLDPQIRPAREDLVAGLRLTGYFLDRHVFAHAPKQGAAEARARLVERMAARI
jgi:DNA repair protein RecO (recombination protein O)